VSFHHGLNPGDILSNQELTEIFKCSLQGGMRRSHKTNSLLLISNHIESLYDDRWDGDILHYTGMGRRGDQSLDFMQNKTLAESNSNHVSVYLFEVYREKEYIFVGEVKLAYDPYTEKQLDADGNLRSVWIFPLKLVDEYGKTLLPEELFQEMQYKHERKARRLSDDELAERARTSSGRAAKREVSTTSYQRDAYIAEYARRRADGVCQLCDNPAPFKDSNGIPYLEIHHIEWLSKGGRDSIDNTVALCPNCHRKMHILSLEADRNKLRLKGQKCCGGEQECGLQHS
jgi:5-methylcytosine-specific restriction protein A